MLSLTGTNVGERTVVTAKGYLDVDTYDQLRSRIGEHVDAGRPTWSATSTRSSSSTPPASASSSEVSNVLEPARVPASTEQARPRARGAIRAARRAPRRR